MTTAFWVSIGFIVYTYLGYHLLLRLVAALFPRPKRAPALPERAELPSVSVIVACYNEEKVIHQRIENLLELDYPKDKLEIIIACDGSTDRTARIAEQYETRGVTVLKLARGGRALAHNRGVTRSCGELIFFTDADVEFDNQFLRQAVRHFEDQKVGCIVGNLIWKEASTSASRFRELSWKFEVDLKAVESRLGILASASGPAMAVRRVLWRPMLDPVDDVDSVTPLDVIVRGYKVVFAQEAIAYDAPFTTAKGDFRSKVRGVSKTIVMIPRRWKARDWFTHPLIAWRMISHHLMRWVAPYCMLLVLLLGCCLWKRGALYRGILVFEIASMLMVVLGYIGERMSRHFPFATLLFSFAVINTGFAVGLVRGLAGAARGPYETDINDKRTPNESLVSG